MTVGAGVFHRSGGYEPVGSRARARVLKAAAVDEEGGF
jgi:hypothetical protein